MAKTDRQESLRDLREAATNAHLLLSYRWERLGRKIDRLRSESIRRAIQYERDQIQKIRVQLSTTLNATRPIAGQEIEAE